MSAISITVTQDTANQALFELMQSVTPARFAGKVGPALVNETKQHLGRLGKNKQGYKSTRFYENFSVFWSPDNRGVSVDIPPAVVNGRQVGLGLRVFGGTITPATAQMLAIPISAASYGRVPRDFPNLFLLKMTDGRAFLCRGASVASSGQAAGEGRLGRAPSHRLNGFLC